MNAIFNKTDKKGFVTLEGDLTLPHAEALKGILIKALLDADDVSIAMKNVQNADISCHASISTWHSTGARRRQS